MSTAHIFMLFLDKTLILLLWCFVQSGPHMSTVWEPVILHLIQDERVQTTLWFTPLQLIKPCAFTTRQEGLKMLPNDWWNEWGAFIIFISFSCWKTVPDGFFSFFTFPGLKVNKSTYFSRNAFTFSWQVFS